MKKLIVVFGCLLMLPAFAEVAPVFYDEVAEYVEEQEVLQEPVTEEVEVEAVKVVAPVSQPSRISPRTASGASVRAGRGAVVSSGTTNARTVATRANTVSARNASQARTAASRSAVSARAGASVASRAGAASSRVASRSARKASTANKAVTTRAASTTNKSVAARAGTLTADAPLYNSNARVGMRSSSAIRARMPSAVSLSSSSASSVGTSTEEKQEAIVNMDELAQMTDYCKAQYTTCMDNFCNVLDDNQGRCSCSKNIKNYEKTELALKAATEALQDVSQQIQYIGLTADDIETLFTQTEAEIAMQSTSDNTQIKNDLDNIRDMIVGIKTGTATSSESGMSFDLSGLMNFSIDSTGFDLTGLFGGNTANTSSISNQRGEQLYKTASARCKASVLTSCQAQGVDIAVITNSYDLEIDRQCVAYERSLTDSNENMNRTVRNAKVVLQKARLMVAQQKNAYDLRGCVNALDSCMQDDFVCGTDYENCLDPTGKYIVNGEVVIGSAPGYFVNNDVAEADKAAPIQHTKGLYATWNYANTKDKNAWYVANESEPTNLAGYIADSISAEAVVDMDSNLVRFLQYKIGYVNENKTYGMCASVLNKCQNYTYSDGKFKNDNQVVREYLQRTLTQIKVAQDEIISSYAENCISDVNSCLSSNNYTAQANYAINACKAQIVTCMSVNGDATATPTPSAMTNWVKSITGTLQASSSEPSEPEDTPEVTCERGYQLFNGSCINPTLITIVHTANGGEGSTKFYAIDGKAYEYQSGGTIGGQITKITVPAKNNATYIGATQASTYNSGDKLCISSSGQINVANCKTGQNYSHWKCNSGYTLNGTSCVIETATMKIVNNYGVPFSTITNENFVCSPDADTQIKVNDYVDIDVVTAENNGLNAGCIRLCYDSAASDPTVNNASTYCDKVPAKSCVSGGKLYLLVDEYCAS